MISKLCEIDFLPYLFEAPKVQPAIRRDQVIDSDIDSPQAE